MEKLDAFISRRVNYVKQTNQQGVLRQMFDQAAIYYKNTSVKKR